MYWGLIRCSHRLSSLIVSDRGRLRNSRFFEGFDASKGMQVCDCECVDNNLFTGGKTTSSDDYVAVFILNGEMTAEERRLC